MNKPNIDLNDLLTCQGFTAPDLTPEQGEVTMYRTDVYFGHLPEDRVSGFGETPEESLADALDALGIFGARGRARFVRESLAGWDDLPAGLVADVERF